jgi:hypothetical protein
MEVAVCRAFCIDIEQSPAAPYISGSIDTLLSAVILKAAKGERPSASREPQRSENEPAMFLDDAIASLQESMVPKTIEENFLKVPSSAILATDHGFRPSSSRATQISVPLSPDAEPQT